MLHIAEIPMTQAKACWCLVVLPRSSKLYLLQCICTLPYLEDLMFSVEDAAHLSQDLKASQSTTAELQNLLDALRGEKDAQQTDLVNLQEEHEQLR